MISKMVQNHADYICQLLKLRNVHLGIKKSAGIKAANSLYTEAMQAGIDGETYNYSTTHKGEFWDFLQRSAYEHGQKHREEGDV